MSKEPYEQTLTSDEYEAPEMDELDFSNDQATASFSELPDDYEDDETLEPVRELGLTEASIPGHGPTDDDLAPEILIPEDGSLSPDELGGAEPTDNMLTTVQDYEIGGGNGLDEAELARIDPLDGEEWDGDPDEPLNPATTIDPDYAADETEDEEEDE